MPTQEKQLRRLDLIFAAANCAEVLEKALARTANEILDELMESDLRGRGGAGFPTGKKWKYAAQAEGSAKYVICNADEGEPGTFKDREILTKVPLKVFTGMSICAHAIGALEGFVYLRGEYKYLMPHLTENLDAFHALLKKNGSPFTIKIKLGSGAYICGEESALFESLEGKRGEPRNKPPYPTTSGFRGMPTVINNVETFVYTMVICQFGALHFRNLGTLSSRGSKVFSISGDTPKPGIYELDFGLHVDEFVDDFGDGDTKAVQVGGASGFCVPRKRFNDTIIAFEGIPTGGSMKLFNSSRSMYHVLHNYLEFFQEESCGQCTPCRIGTQQLLLGIEAVKKGTKPTSYLENLVKLADMMKITAKCGLGQSVGNSFKSIVENFREEMIY